MQSRFGTISASELAPSLSSDLSWAGSVKSRVVASNSIGVGAVLRPNIVGELVEADGSAAPVSPGVFIAIESGTGSRRVLYWGGGWIRNDAWTFTPGLPLYLDQVTPGGMSHLSNGSAPIGFAESATTVYFGQVHNSFSEEVATATVTMTISGTDFEAFIALDTDTYPDAEATWTFPDASTSASTHPDVTGVGAGDVVLEVTPAAALTYLNVGYDGGDDGPVEIDLLAQQNVTAITGLSSAPALDILCTSNNPITTLDLSGLSALTDAELFSCTALDTLTLSGNTSLLRLCIEGCSVATLDISGCTALTDIRAGSNGMTNLNFGDLDTTLEHICVNQNPGLNQLPSVDRFTSLTEFLMFGSNQSGVFDPAAPNLGNVAIEDNAYTSVDISGCGAVTSLNASNNAITSVYLSNNTGLLSVDLSDNSLNETQIDAVLAVLDAYALDNMVIDLTGNVPPSATGMADVVSIQGRGGTVAVDSSAPYVVTYDPGDGDTGVAIDATMTLTFNEAVTAVSGNIDLYDDTDALVESFDVTTDITGSGTTEISFTPASNLTADTGYYIQIDAGALEDSESNAYPGIADTTTWNFTTASAGTQLFLDDFNRADGSVGNNWLDYGSPTSAIVSNHLELSHSGYAAIYNMCGDALPADYSFQASIPSGSLATRYEWGVGVRCIYTGVPELDGIRVFLNGLDPIVAGNTKAFNADPVTVTVTNGFPASWSVDQAHTLEITCVGTTITIILDGQEYGYFTSAVNNQAATGIAFLGNPNGGVHAYDDATVTSV